MSATHRGTRREMRQDIDASTSAPSATGQTAVWQSWGETSTIAATHLSHEGRCDVVLEGGAFRSAPVDLDLDLDLAPYATENA